MTCFVTSEAILNAIGMWIEGQACFESQLPALYKQVNFTAYRMRNESSKIVLESLSCVDKPEYLHIEDEDSDVDIETSSDMLLCFFERYTASLAVSLLRHSFSLEASMHQLSLLSGFSSLWIDARDVLAIVYTGSFDVPGYTKVASEDVEPVAVELRRNAMLNACLSLVG